MKPRIIFAAVALNVVAIVVLFYMVLVPQSQGSGARGQQQQTNYSTSDTPFFDAAFNDGEGYYSTESRLHREMNELRRDTDRRFEQLQRCERERSAGTRPEWYLC